MKNVNAFLFFAFFIGSNLLHAQNITGPTSVNAGTTYSYTFSDDSIIPNPIWNVSPGSVGSTSQSGLNYYANIQWTGTGVSTGTLTFKNGTTTLATLTVTITGQPDPPSVVHGSTCGPGTVTLSATTGAGGTSVRWYTALTKGTYLGEGNSYTTPSLSTTTTYYVSSYNSSTGLYSSPRTPVTATVNPVSTGGSVSGNATHFSGFATAQTLTLSGHVGSVQRWEQNTGSGWVIAIPGSTTTSLTYSNLTVNTQFRAIVKNGTCPEVASSSVTITIVSLPVITLSPDAIPYGGSSLLSVPSGYSSYQWKKAGVVISGATTLSYTATEPADYQVTITQSGVTGPGTASATLKPFYLGQAKNLHSVTSILQSGVTNTTNVYTLPADKLKQTVEYQDGYGRTYQVVAVGQAVNGKDIVVPTGYGSQGLVERSYLPYIASTDDGKDKPNAIRGTDFQYTTSEQYLFYQNTPLIATDQYPYADKKLADSPLANIKEQGAPGYDWQLGNGHTAKMDMLANVASQVRHWKASGLTTGYYTANLIAVSQTTDENGNKVRTFSDKMGRTILKQVQMDETLDGVSTPWLETYYIYDTYGRVKYILPPKALKILGTSGSLDANNTSVAELIHTFVYDARGRVVEKKVPGAVVQYIVYDQFDRVVLTQDGNLRAGNKWAFIKYDIDNRPVYTGIYTNTTQTTRAAVQNELDIINYDSAPWYETEGTTVHGYTNTVFPTAGTSANVILNVSYYDHYNFDRTSGDDFTYDAAHLSGQEAARSTRTRGMTTGGKRNVLDAAGNTTTYWITSAVFYDKFSRPIQTQSNNHLHTGFTGATLDKVTVIYDFTRATKTKTSHYQNATTAVHLEDWNDVDHAGRVTRTYRKINGGATQVVAQYSYNLLGQLIDKKLHDTGGSTFLQSIDYRYNIRGWLTSINNAQLVNDQLNDDTNDYFGMELIYNTTESGLSNTQYYNGNISALKWKGYGTTGTADQRSYKYNYDKSDRLKTATFQAYTGTAWTKEAGTLNETMTYDHNGNIKALERKRNLRGNTGITITATPETFDNLTYTYQKVNGSATENTDKMVKVEDGIAGAVGQSGFNNAATSDTEFGYNTDGSLITDNNKGISSITYNVLGKPQVITYSGSPSKTITYTYDAAGSKLKMTTLVNGVTTTTDYAGGFVYTNNALSFFSSPEGRIVKNGANFEYQYAITDHQGNTRVVFSSVTPTTQTVTATYETAAQSTEATQFNNYPSASGINVVSTNNSTPGGTRSQYLNAGYAGMVGVAKSYKVYAGDKVKLEAYARYNAPSSTNSSITSFATVLLNAFGLPTPAGGETGTAASAVNTWGAIAAGGFGNGAPANGLPKAFVNIVLFDQNYKLIDFAYAQVTSSGAPTKIEREYTVKEAGYAYLFISNEHPTQCDVYFDDVKMSFTPSNVVQYNEYYPFGMNTANSWTRENTTGNNFLGNGGTELNTTSNLYDLDYRNYDPILGRMNGVDPMATKYASLSPYNFSFNDPVTFSDPSGADPYQRSDDTWWVAPRQSGKYAGFSSFQDYAFQNQSGYVGELDPWAWTGMGSGDIYGPSFSMYGIGSGQGSISHQEYMIAVEQAKAQGGRVEYHHGRYWVSIPLVRTFFVDTPDDPYYSGYNVTMTWAGREDILVSGGGIRPARNRGSKGKNESAMSAAWAISGVLLLDDGSGVGVADDIVIPFLLAAAFVSDLINDRPLVPYQGNPNYPGPWTTTKPDTTNPFYNSSGNTSYESGDPEGLPPGIGVGLGASIGIMKLMQDHFERKDRLQQHVHPQDATKYVMPRIMPK